MQGLYNLLIIFDSRPIINDKIITSMAGEK